MWRTKMSKWFNLDAEDYFVRAVNKQLRSDGVSFDDNWYKCFACLETWLDDEAIYINLKHRPSGKLFTTAAICASEDIFDDRVGNAICANRMARHSDFLDIIRRIPVTHMVNYTRIPLTSILEQAFI